MPADKDTRDLKRFTALAARLAPLERKQHITEAECLKSERLMYRMADIRDSASPTVRKIIKQRYGWQ